MTAAARRPLPPLPPTSSIERVHIIGICGTAMGTLQVMDGRYNDPIDSIVGDQGNAWKVRYRTLNNYHRRFEFVYQKGSGSQADVRAPTLERTQL